MKNRIASPKHETLRSGLRVAGPVTAVAGLLLIVIGMVSFFSAMGSFEPPRYFWCAFVGMPVAFVGIVMCKLGYFGAVVRYIAAESAPVAKDTVNYMAEGTQEGIRTVARAVAQGIRDGQSDTSPPASDDKKS